jgi:hypothetical protein
MTRQAVSPPAFFKLKTSQRFVASCLSLKTRTIAQLSRILLIRRNAKLRNFAVLESRSNPIIRHIGIEINSPPIRTEAYSLVPAVEKNPTAFKMRDGVPPHSVIRADRLAPITRPVNRDLRWGRNSVAKSLLRPARLQVVPTTCLGCLSGTHP